MTISQLAMDALGVLEVWDILVCCMLVYIAVRFVQQRRGIVRIGVQVLLAACVWLFAQGVGQVQHADDGPLLLQPVFGNVPVVVALALLATATFFACWQQWSIGRWANNHITADSVKQGMEALSIGLCYYWPSGLPKLVNETMEELCSLVTGSPLVDASQFWADVCNGRVDENTRCIQKGEQPIVHVGDGRIVSFRRNELELSGYLLYEIVAQDISEEYAISLELEDKQHQADAVNRSLRELNETITQMTIEKEVLKTKAWVHDEFGQALLLAKRYIQVPESVDKAQVLQAWRQSVMLLLRERPESWQEAYAEPMRQALMLGVEVEVDGTLPEEGRAHSIVDKAISTHVTNVLRHAHGTKLFVRCAREPGGAYVVEFSNDGDPPQDYVRETGGLADLRRMVEDAGGSMNVQSTPRYVLTLRLEER